MLEMQLESVRLLSEDCKWRTETTLIVSTSLLNQLTYKQNVVF